MSRENKPEVIGAVKEYKRKHNEWISVNVSF